MSVSHCLRMSAVLLCLNWWVACPFMLLILKWSNIPVLFTWIIKRCTRWKMNLRTVKYSTSQSKTISNILTIMKPTKNWRPNRKNRAAYMSSIPNNHPYCNFIIMTHPNIPPRLNTTTVTRTTTKIKTCLSTNSPTCPFPSKLVSPKTNKTKKTMTVSPWAPCWANSTRKIWTLNLRMCCSLVDSQVRLSTSSVKTNSKIFLSQTQACTLKGK